MRHEGCCAHHLPLVHALRIRKRRTDARLHHFPWEIKRKAGAEIRPTDC